MKYKNFFFLLLIFPLIMQGTDILLIKEKIIQYSKIYNVNQDLITEIVRQESNFNPNAKSAKGAKGLMQLMSSTAKKFGVKNRYDVDQNLQGGIKYLKYLKKIFKNNIPLVLAAYNAGEGSVKKYNGIPPFPETRKYVKRILKRLNQGTKIIARSMNRTINNTSSMKVLKTCETI